MARIASGSEPVESARKLLKSGRTAEELRLAQSVLLPLEPGLSIEQTALAVGRSSGATCTMRTRLARIAAGWHQSKGLKPPENLRLHVLPPSSPELNPQEHIRDELRELYFHNQAFDSLDALEAQPLAGLRHLEQAPEIVKSISAGEGDIQSGLQFEFELDVGIPRAAKPSAHFVAAQTRHSPGTSNPAGDSKLRIEPSTSFHTESHS